MKLKIIALGFFVLLLLASIPIVNSRESKNIISTNTNEIGDLELFTTCFIEADGEIAYNIDWPSIIKIPNMWKSLWFRPFNNDQAIVTYWMLVYNYDSNIRIYDRKNGDILWEYQGFEYPQLRIFGFFGKYISSTSDDDSFNVSLSGRALIVLTNLRG